MKAKHISLTFPAVLALLVAACANPASPERETANKGLVLVSLSGAASTKNSAATVGAESRSVIPALEQDDFGYMLYAETDSANLENTALPLSPGSALPLELDSAHWTIRVKAWEDGVPDIPDAEVPAFEGSAELDVSAGQTTPLTIALKPVQLYQESRDIIDRKILTPTRFGTFDYSITFAYDAEVTTGYPGDLNYAQLYVYPLEGALYYERSPDPEGNITPLESGAVYPIKGSLEPLEEGVHIMLIDLLRGAEADGNNKKAEASVSLPVGFYRITTQLNRTDGTTQKYAGDTEVIAVYKDKTVEYSATHAPGAFLGLITNTMQNVFSNIWGTGNTTLQGYLAAKPQNTRDTPYLIGISGANAKLDGSGTVNASLIGTTTNPLLNLFSVLQGRYVIYDLSKCTTTSNTIPNSTAYEAGYTRVYTDRVTGIILPSTITTIGSYAFYRCSSLTQITLPADLTTINAGAFGSCSSLETIVLPENLTTFGGNTVFSGCSALIAVDIPAGVGSIPATTFSNCTALQSVTLRKSDGIVTLVNISAFTSALYDQKPDFAIYVPTDLVDDYEGASNWSTMNTNWKTGAGNSEGSIFRAIP
jgi:hypothetical protein